MKTKQERIESMAAFFIRKGQSVDMAYAEAAERIDCQDAERDIVPEDIECPCERCQGILE